jgi:hypothetical protein
MPTPTVTTECLLPSQSTADQGVGYLLLNTRNIDPRNIPAVGIGARASPIYTPTTSTIGPKAQNSRTQASSCYQNLEDSSRGIRLLQVLPSPHPEDRRLQCKLVISKCDVNSRYIALSYTWGKLDKRNFSIWVNNVLVPVGKT